MGVLSASTRQRLPMASTRTTHLCHLVLKWTQNTPDDQSLVKAAGHDVLAVGAELQAIDSARVGSPLGGHESLCEGAGCMSCIPHGGQDLCDWRTFLPLTSIKTMRPEDCRRRTFSQDLGMSIVPYTYVACCCLGPVVRECRAQDLAAIVVKDLFHLQAARTGRCEVQLLVLSARQVICWSASQRRPGYARIRHKRPCHCEGRLLLHCLAAACLYRLHLG